MPHDIDLIILLAVGFGLALVFGYIAARIRLPPLIGYLIAGIIIESKYTRYRRRHASCQPIG